MNQQQEGNASRHQILDLHRQFPHANTCRVVDRCRDSGGYADVELPLAETDNDLTHIQ
jgi:hypothetical protein